MNARWLIGVRAPRLAIAFAGVLASLSAGLAAGCERATGRRVVTVRQPHPPASGEIIDAPAAADGAGHVFITMSGGTLSFDEP